MLPDKLDHIIEGLRHAPRTRNAVQTMVEEAKALIAELCSSLYNQGHVAGSGGGISIRIASTDAAPLTANDRIVMAPSGVQKERMRPEDMFVLDGTGAVLDTPPARPAPYKPPKLSECAPLFMSVRTCSSAIGPGLIPDISRLISAADN
jgi:methylthioribulose 1-phosphate dehydratase/enolase-phosphatase E1